MYKKRSSVCLMIGIIFNSYGMDSVYETVPLIDEAYSLVEALKNLDAAYEKKETRPLCKKIYKELVKENQEIIEDVQSCYGQWNDIRDLDLPNKDLRTIFVVLPSYVNPRIIKSVNFSHNNLQDLPLSLFAKTMPNLEGLHVSHNKISYVSTYGKRSFNGLIHLSMNDNQLTEIDLEALLKKCPALKKLDLFNNPLTSLLWPSKKVEVCPLHKDFAIDVRHTQLSPESIALLKNYCLRCVHATIKCDSYRFCLAASVWGSIPLGGIFTVLSPLFVQHISFGVGGIGACVGVGIATGASYIFHKQEMSGHREFYNMRSDYELVTDSEVVTIQEDNLSSER